MAWKIKFVSKIEKQLRKIPAQEVQKIFDFLKQEVARDPRAIGKPLKGQLREFWRYRIGNYRITTKIQDDELVVLIIKIGHRKDIYLLRKIP
ncbi:type II toxin-antitoxin system RelE/ParE family toxin [Desulfothermus okinawensis JCM 13304]